MIAINLHGHCLYYIEKPDKNMCLVAIKNDANLNLVPVHLRDREICM